MQEFRFRGQGILFFEKCSVVGVCDVTGPLSIMHAPLRRARFCSNYEFRKRNIKREKIMAVAFFLNIGEPPLRAAPARDITYYFSIKQ